RERGEGPLDEIRREPRRVRGWRRSRVGVARVAAHAAQQCFEPRLEQLAPGRCAKADRTGHAVHADRDTFVRDAGWQIKQIARVEHPLFFWLEPTQDL